MDGKLKRSDGGDDEPIPAFAGLVNGTVNGGDALACSTSATCRAPPRDRSYCFEGKCVSGGGTVFDAVAFLGQTGTAYTELQTGVLGGHLRVASVGAFDATSGVGFEMMAFGPLKHDNDTILIAIRAAAASGDGGAAAAAAFSYFSISLDRRGCVGAKPAAGTCDGAAGSPCCTVAPEVFYAAVLQHTEEWEAAFAGGISRRRGCHFADVSSTSLLKRLLKGEGGAAE